MPLLFTSTFLELICLSAPFISLWWAWQLYSWQIVWCMVTTIILVTILDYTTVCQRMVTCALVLVCLLSYSDAEEQDERTAWVVVIRRWKYQICKNVVSCYPGYQTFLKENPDIFYQFNDLAYVERDCCTIVNIWLTLNIK